MWMTGAARCGSPSSSTARRVGASRGRGAALADPVEQRRVDGVGGVARLGLGRRSSFASDASVTASPGPRGATSRRRRRAPPRRPRRRRTGLDVELGREGLARDERRDARMPRPRRRASSVRPRRMRSPTSSPAVLRASCTARTTSRARPSASSSGVVAVSRMTKPPSASSASALEPSPDPPASSTRSYSPGSSAMPPATTPSPSTVQSPDRAAWIACCTVLPSRGPAARAFTLSRFVTPYALGARLVERDEVDGLHVELVAQDALERRERRGIRGHDREPREREAHPAAGLLAQREGRAA